MWNTLGRKELELGLGEVRRTEGSNPYIKINQIENQVPIL
jgi:hypothetical protein